MKNKSKIILTVVILFFFVEGYGQNQTINGTLTVKSRINIIGNASQILHLRPDAGNPGYIYWAENGVAERGILGFNVGSGALVYRSKSTGFSNGFERFRISEDGKVGIGTATPYALFSVHTGYAISLFPTTTSKGDIIQFLESGNNGIEFGSARASNERKSWILARHSSNTYGKYYSTLHLQPDIGDMSQYKGVAIGYKPSAHINSGFNLSVNGKIESEEIKVQDIIGADFVFEPNYNLPTLEATEAYIKANKHLPEIPSAAEMEANGLELGKMNMLLLQKIEELTLYVIELKKENERQNNKIAMQDAVIDKLKKTKTK